jgi:hypothetical protein
MTVGFPQGRSEYEPDPRVQLDYMGAEFQNGFREIRIGWDRWGFLSPGDRSMPAQLRALAPVSPDERNTGADE